MKSIEKVFYTAKVHTTGGREGTAKSDDGRLEVHLSPPTPSSKGTNPEQMFAAGWSACFLSALKHVSADKKIELPADVSIDAEVDLGSTGDGFSLAARLKVNLPGLDKGSAETLVHAAHEVCPYSVATRGNIDVSITVG